MLRVVVVERLRLNTDGPQGPALGPTRLLPAAAGSSPECLARLKGERRPRR